MNVVAKEYPAAAMMTSVQQNIEAGNSSDKRQPALDIFSVWCGFIDGRAPDEAIPKPGVFRGSIGYHIPAFTSWQLVFHSREVSIGFGANPLGANALYYLYDADKPDETDKRKYIKTIVDDFLNNEIEIKGLNWISKNTKALMKIDMAKRMQKDIIDRIESAVMALNHEYPGKKVPAHDQNSPFIEFRGIKIPSNISAVEAGKTITANVLKILADHKAISPSQKEMATDYLTTSLLAMPERPITFDKAKPAYGNPFIGS